MSFRWCQIPTGQYIGKGRFTPMAFTIWGGLKITRKKKKLLSFKLRIIHPLNNRNINNGHNFS